MSTTRSKIARSTSVTFDEKASEALKGAVASAFKEKSSGTALKVRFPTEYQEMEDPYEAEEQESEATVAKQQDDAEARKALWKKALDEAGVPFATKGTKAYAAVMKIFQRLREDESPAIKLWNAACAAEGVKYAKKGTNAYDAVKRRFDYMKKRAGELKDPFDFSEF